MFIGNLRTHWNECLHSNAICIQNYNFVFRVMRNSLFGSIKDGKKGSMRIKVIRIHIW